jgi:hypothetical protein
MTVQGALHLGVAAAAKESKTAAANAAAVFVPIALAIFYLSLLRMTGVVGLVRSVTVLAKMGSAPGMGE